jgi:hypothetical protein
MALTIVVPNTSVFDQVGQYSPQYVKYVQVTGDTSYSAGGYPVTPGTFGFSTKILAIENINPLATTPTIAIWDPVYSQLRFYNAPTTSPTAMLEVTTTANISKLILDLAVVGWSWLVGLFGLATMLALVAGIA